MFGFVLGFAICYGIRAIMRMIIKDEATADEITFTLTLAILIITLIFVYISY